MIPRLSPLAARCALVALLASPLAAQTPAPAPVGPQAGDVAPDFTLAAATQAGVSAKPVRLADLKGRTVVVAFFPKARTSGCTIQMKAYRDRYAELFHSGKSVTLLAISRDPADTLAAWAKDEKFPFTFVSDADGKAGELYATLTQGRPYESRVAFVIGPDGKIAKVFRPFREVDPTAYTDLGAAVEAAMQVKAK